MKKATVVSIYNEKGGVGKTHTTTQLALVLAATGHKILVIDNDPSNDATTALTCGQIPPEISEVFKPTGVANTVNLYAEGMPCVPFKVNDGIELIGASERLSAIVGEDATWTFVDNVEKLSVQYDFILIDCQPSIGPLSSAAMKASDGVLIPCLADPFSYNSAVKVMSRLRVAQRREAKAAKLVGVFINRLKKPMAKSVKAVIETMHQDFGNMFMMNSDGPIALCETVKHGESMAMGQSIFESAPTSTAAKEIGQLVQEILNRLNNLDELNEEYRAQFAERSY